MCQAAVSRALAKSNYPAFARELKALGYAGNIGLEAWASGDNELALRRFREAFTVPG